MIIKDQRLSTTITWYINDINEDLFEYMTYQRLLFRIEKPPKVIH